MFNVVINEKLYLLFFRQTSDTARLKDAEEIERQMREKQAEIAAYRAYRERVEAWREQDRIARNQAKIKQLEMCEQIQVQTNIFKFC